MLMPWNKSLNLGIAAIDKQHRELYEMLNDLSQSMAQGRGKIAAARVMSRLSAFLRRHFAEEEKTLRRLNSPEYPRCCAQHAKQLEIIQSFLQGKSANDPSAVIDLLYFLDSLLDGHIESDRRALGLEEEGAIQ